MVPSWATVYSLVVKTSSATDQDYLSWDQDQLLQGQDRQIYET